MLDLAKGFRYFAGVEFNKESVLHIFIVFLLGVDTR